jgi:hypothetical protein
VADHVDPKRPGDARDPPEHEGQLATAETLSYRHIASGGGAVRNGGRLNGQHGRRTQKAGYQQPADELCHRPIIPERTLQNPYTENRRS